MATELPATPSTGHSVTHIKDASEGSAAMATAGAVDAAPKVGGNGQPAYRGDDGHVHGPGGPVFIGEGPMCDASIDHCQRGDGWFCATKFAAGAMYRATPCFEFEGKWWSWRGEEIDKGGLVFKTRVAKPGDVKAGDPVVFFTPESHPRDKFVNSEYEALTSSRWDVGVADSASGSTWVTKAWPDPIDLDVTRVVVEQKSN
ncbi:MAG TPA: hypothetical protein VLT45_16470 [Kofleriaceae bacterium]|nr:hypothetical protein [Kofleriaceae bacterium]